jgi:hypothetical protein
MVIIASVVISLTSCAPQIELTSSWHNKQAEPKNSPLIMVMVMGKNLANRQAAEGYMVNEFAKLGDKAIGSLDLFKPDVQTYDSATMVNLLRDNKIDMILISGITSVNEKERYVPGTTERVPVGTYATPHNPYYYNDYNNYYNYYNYQQTYYQTVYETRETPGYTVTDVQVIVESKLFDVHTTQLLWFGQSTSYTQEPSNELFGAFSKHVVEDIHKGNLITKQVSK